ncbi:MAG TPA: histidine phosphatase family protein [Mycobacterium sp.]|nr:histidine phosphatase family protein [Mycobacterium sp.]
MHQFAIRAGITAGVTVIGTGLVAAAPVTVPPPTARLLGIQLTAGAEDITLDFVRHGQSTDDLNGILGTLPPGAHLTPLGVQQSDEVAQDIQQEYPAGLSGVYASQLIRTQETAAAVAHDFGTNVQVLPDLNEIPAGVLEEQPRNLFVEAGYFFPMAAWILGNLSVTEPGTTYNGAQFDEQVTNAVDTIYNNTVAGNGPPTDVAVSSGGVIAIWTLLNVKNPDFLAIIDSVLKNGGPPPNAGQDIIEGNPTDGWTLVSWDGTPVPQTPNLIDALYVDYRDLFMAEQLAIYNIGQAIQGGDQADITAALQTGYSQIVAAMEEFPKAVAETFAQASSDGASTAGAAAGESVSDSLLGSL